jgi:hypothetical protein
VVEWIGGGLDVCCDETNGFIPVDIASGQERPAELPWVYDKKSLRFRNKSSESAIFQS